jgi:hypothetical protein
VFGGGDGGSGGSGRVVGGINNYGSTLANGIGGCCASNYGEHINSISPL